MKRIGLLCGREYTFPQAFLTRVNERGAAHGVTADLVRLGGTRMDDLASYDLIVDRASRDVVYYRGVLKHAALQGTRVINNPFWAAADDRFFDAALLARLGVAVPRTVLLPQKGYPWDVDITSEGLRNLEYPLDWDALASYVKFPAILKPAYPGGWGHVDVVHSMEALWGAYDGTSPYCMMLQEYIEYDQYVRCFCFGPDEVLPVAYDPRERRYMVIHEYLSAELGARVVADARRINRALGLHVNAVEFAIAGGVPFVIDCMNPAPDFERERITPFYFERVVDRMAELAISTVTCDGPAVTWPAWPGMIGA